ncbi:hypothetical protein M8C21_000576 [Ambrosia artemisiifolia]|uniref:Uncharacterized protein n=1 Tax=Ambrosia artemisiifolia TaxID=4212 RepID=A0AAD5C821_AMBAR|nr:hypothetical protein M8C21_000576 [Ambrosia artemisiifolia]
MVRFTRYCVGGALVWFLIRRRLCFDGDERTGFDACLEAGFLRQSDSGITVMMTNGVKAEDVLRSATLRR